MAGPWGLLGLNFHLGSGQGASPVSQSLSTCSLVQDTVTFILGERGFFFLSLQNCNFNLIVIPNDITLIQG